jgi:Fe2+ transport system protein FeoA
MVKKKTLLANLPVNKKARILSLHHGYHGRGHHGRHHHSGYHFHQKMCVMGIREGQIIEVISKQPFFGPLTIAVGKCKMTIGRGMAHKIIVEEL